jgi:hypothetical protein
VIAQRHDRAKYFVNYDSVIAKTLPAAVNYALRSTTKLRPDW